MDQTITWFAGIVLDALNTVVGILRSTAFWTPNVTAVPQVRSLWSQNMTIVNALYLLAVVAAGVLAMTHESVQIRYSIKELSPRLVFGFIAANFSLQWSSMIFDDTNVLTQALTGQPIAGAGAVDAVRTQVVAALQNPTGEVLAVVVSALIVVLVFMLMFSWIVRFGVLLILTVSAPFALACHGLPQCDPVAKLWWRTLFGTLGTQLLQALALTTGLRVFLDPAANIPAMLGMGAGEVVNLLVLVVVLWTTIKIPGLMRRFVLRGGGGGNLGGYILRVVLVQQVMGRVLPRGVGRFARTAVRGGR
jgi:hypothetical protein